jgi:protein ImuA
LKLTSNRRSSLISMSSTLSQLKRQLAALEPARSPGEKGFTLGLDQVDAALGGGLPRGCLHEVFAHEVGDAGASAGFALALALRAAGEGRHIVWVRHAFAVLEQGDLYAPGLAQFGIDPDRVLLISAKSETMVLRAGLEALRSPALGAVLLEIWGKAGFLDLTASRRMMLAASRSGVTGFILRAAGQPQPSSSLTRWQVRAAPSVGLAAGAPSNPVFDILLDRHRAGIAGGRWHLEWNRDRKSFDLSAAQPARFDEPLATPKRSAAKPLPGSVVSLPVDRPAASPEDQKPFRKTG